MNKQLLYAYNGNQYQSTKIEPTNDGLRVNVENTVTTAVSMSGTHNNLFGPAQAVTFSTASSVVDLDAEHTISILGDSDADILIKVEASLDNTNWYDTHINIQTGIGDFYTSIVFPPRYIKLRAEGNANVNASVCGK